jgi:hypothetical protein
VPILASSLRPLGAHSLCLLAPPRDEQIKSRGQSLAQRATEGGGARIQLWRSLAGTLLAGLRREVKADRETFFLRLLRTVCAHSIAGAWSENVKL